MQMQRPVLPDLVRLDGPFDGNDSQTSLLSLEPLQDVDSSSPSGSGSGGRAGGRMPRRRSSNISFEKHNSVVMEQMCALIDAELEDENGGVDVDSLDGIPTAEQAPEDPEEEEAAEEAERPNARRRSSEASVNLNDVALAVESYQNTGGGGGSRRGSFQGSRRGSFHGSRRGGSMNGSSDRLILSRIQDEIIEKEIRRGKLVVDDEDDGVIHEDEAAAIATAAASMQASFNSLGSAAGRRGSQPRRTSFARRGSSSVRSSSSGGRRISFTGGRSTVTAGRSSFSSAASASTGRLSFSSAASSGSRGRGGGGPSLASFQAGPGLQGDIHAALADLADEIDLSAYDSDNDEEGDDAAIARAVLATTGGDTAAGPARQRGSITVEVEMAVPPPRGAMPRRSSMKRPDQRRDWS